MSEVVNRTPNPQVAFNCAHDVDLDHPCEQCAAEHAPTPPAPIQAGDIVQLKSGGPRMVVLHVGETSGVPKAVLAWFGNGESELRQVPGMPLSALVKAP